MDSAPALMADSLRKIIEKKDVIKFTNEIGPELKEKEELTRQEREKNITKMKKELEHMESELEVLKIALGVENEDDKPIIVYPCDPNLLSNYIEYKTLQTKISITKDVLRIRELPLEQRAKQITLTLISVKEEDKAAAFMFDTFGKLTDNNTFSSLIQEVKDEKKTESSEEPTYSRRLNKKDPKVEIKVTKTDKKAVFSVVMEDEEEEIQDADVEEDGDILDNLRGVIPGDIDKEDLRKQLLDMVTLAAVIVPGEHNENLEFSREILGGKKDIGESKT